MGYEPRYYRLTELAQYWGKTEEDILYFGCKGLLMISTLAVCSDERRFRIQGPVHLLPFDIERLILHGATIVEVLTYEGKEVFPARFTEKQLSGIVFSNWPEKQPINLKREALFVTEEEVNRFEKHHPETIQGKGRASMATNPKAEKKSPAKEKIATEARESEDQSFPRPRPPGDKEPIRGLESMAATVGKTRRALQDWVKHEQWQGWQYPGSGVHYIWPSDLKKFNEVHGRKKSTTE